MIWLKATGRMLTAICKERVTSGSAGMEAQFTFSDDWDGLTRTAVFKGSGTQIDVLLTGDTCTIPWEVLQHSGGMLTIGVYGADGSGTVVIPTIWRDVRRIEPGTTPGYITPSPATQDELAQIREIAEDAEDKAPYIVDYDQSASARPDVDEIVAAFDAGKAVLACATDADGGGHVLPLTEITRESGAVTELHFCAGGWRLVTYKMFTNWLWYLSEIEQPIADIVLTFSAAWNDHAGGYAVSTDATLQHIGTALTKGQHIDARLYVSYVKGHTDDFIQLKLRQGTVCAVYVGENTSSLDSVTIGFFGEAGEIWELSGTGSGWELVQLAIGGSSIELDTTLSKPGEAADAAAVGAALAAKGTYSKPSGGIPASDLASAVQTSLGKADTAYQKPSGGIPKTDLASAVQTSLGKADTAYQKPSGGIPASDLAAGVIPDLSGYATEQWVENQGYLKQHQSLDNYQAKAITDAGGYYTTDTVDGALQEIGAELAGINTLIGSGVIT